MEKLEYLQKLNPYLPYDLGVISGDPYDTDDRLEHKGIMSYQHSSDENARSKDFSITEIAFSDNNIVTRVGVIKRKVKPVLRPLSDLYKEIDGKVGIVELAKIEHPCSTYHILRNKVVEVAGDNQSSMSFKYDLDDNYFINSNFDCDDEYYPIMYILDLFTYLFSHHYDVYGLIDKGLAIDINSISHE